MYEPALTLVPLHRAVRALYEAEHLDNGFVSFLTCWGALQCKRNYGLTVGRGPYKGPIIRGWWSEHVAHDQEKQWHWKVIKVTRRVKPCKLHSPSRLLAVLLFSLSFSHPVLVSFSLTSCCCISLRYHPLQTLLTLGKLFSPSVHHSSSLGMFFFLLSPSIHHSLTHESSSYLLCAKAVNKWTAASLSPVPCIWK